jgi:hypothetical protein
VTEAVHVHQKEGHERCAFCHDGFDDQSGKGMIRTECATCGAPHHAECFVENARCAVMACNGTEVKKVGGLEERVTLPDLARRTGAQVDVPIPPGVRIDQARREIRAALVVAGFVALTVLLGAGTTNRAFSFVTMGAMVVCLVAFSFLGLKSLMRSLREGPTQPDERVGPPCPRCGEPLQLAREGRTFCFRCDGGPSEEG